MNWVIHHIQEKLLAPAKIGIRYIIVGSRAIRKQIFVNPFDRANRLCSFKLINKGNWVLYLKEFIDSVRLMLLILEAGIGLARTIFGPLYVSFHF